MLTEQKGSAEGGVLFRARRAQKKRLRTMREAFMPGGHKTAPEGRGAIRHPKGDTLLRPKGAGRFCRGGRPRAAVSAEGALRMRHTPCGCCPPDHACGAGLSPTAYFFLSCQKKVCKKEALDAFYSAYAQKNRSLHCACCRFPVRSPNALRATVESGFLSARYTVRFALFAPVEYLTYGSRSISDLT